jgi:uncharacterized protein (TIGR00290 family)
MGLELRTTGTTWDEYEENFIGLLRDVRRQGIESIVFGDIDIEAHRDWEEQAARAAGMAAHLPLWRTARRSLLDEWWALGFTARTVMVRQELLDRSYVGRLLDRALVAEFEARGIDASGENGEFHTLVTGGPLFSAPLELVMGRRLNRDGCWFQDVLLRDSKTVQGSR